LNKALVDNYSRLALTIHGEIRGKKKRKEKKD